MQLILSLFQRKQTLRNYDNVQKEGFPEKIIKVDPISKSLSNHKTKKNISPTVTYSRNSQKVVTTPTIQNTFQRIFHKQVSKDSRNKKMFQCGLCRNCILPECGKCILCHQANENRRKIIDCIHKTCLNIVKIAIAEICDSKKARVVSVSSALTTVGRRTYYSGMLIGKIKVQTGDFVLTRGEDNKYPEALKVQSIWRNNDVGTFYFHAQTFYRSCDTILGDIGNPNELFLTRSCFLSVRATLIVGVINVKRKRIFSTNNGNTDDTLFYSKMYCTDEATFEDIPEYLLSKDHFPNPSQCPSCKYRLKIYNNSLPSFINKDGDAQFKCNGIVYKKGSAVFLKPDTFDLFNFFELQHNISMGPRLEDTDIDCTEFYRKKYDTEGTSKYSQLPYCVGYIENINFTGDPRDRFVSPFDINVTVTKLYRPENIKGIDLQIQSFDTNLLYWSCEKQEISIMCIVRPCELYYLHNIPKNITLDEWSSQNMDRFYFIHRNEREFVTMPPYAKLIGLENTTPIKNGEGSKGKRYKCRGKGNTRRVAEPMKSMDIFAGCGGLSEGLHQSKVAVCHWAIESVSSAAHAFQLNNRECSVFQEDCNSILHKLLNGEEDGEGGGTLPQPGEVELLCAGPPCQGFSALNRFTKRSFSVFKSSQVATALSFCDYYHPKYFLLENVRNFATYEGGMVLKLTLFALLQMGYQCRFGILQAGNFGVPQTRRRLFIVAATPGFDLPVFPKPTHVFNSTSLSISLGNVRFSHKDWDDSGPRRNTTIYDALSDLPFIRNDPFSPPHVSDIPPSKQIHKYTDFQRKIRNNVKYLYDHDCKTMPPLVFERIIRIPQIGGSDWRNLPNVEVTLPDGTHIPVSIFSKSLI